MKATQLQADGERTYAVIFEKGDEVLAGLTEFARRERLQASQLTAVGAFERSVLGYFDRETMDYVKIPVDEQVEVLALVGDIATEENGEPKVHMHVVVGRRDGTTRGGHIMEAHVWPTLEVIVTESPAHLRRKTDPETGLALIDTGRKSTAGKR